MRLIVVSIFFVGTIVFADENSFQTIIQSSLSEWIRNIELSDDGSYLAYSEDNAIIVWDLNQKKIIRRFFGHDFNIRNIKISHNGEFIVSEDIGFDLNNTTKTFGLVQPGQSSSREVSIENNHNIPVLVIIKSKGEISNFLIVSENDFILKPNEKKEISFSVFPTKDIEFREYNGFVEIVLKKI